MTHARAWLTRTMILVFAGGLLAAPESNRAADVPAADYGKVLDHQLKVLQDTLKGMKDAKENDVKRMQEKVRCTLILIAALAQDDLSGPDAAQRLGTRDGALKIHKLLKKEPGKIDDALKLADGLKSAKAEPEAKAQKVKLFEEHIALDEVMTAFKLPKAGGQGIEAQLLKLSTDKKKMIPAAAMNDSLLAAGYQSALIAELSIDYVPDKKLGTVKDWKAYCGDMKKSGIELAEKIKASDGKGAFAALTKLNTSCTVCHDKFRK